MVGDAVLLVVVRPDLLAAAPAADLRPALGGEFVVAFGLGDFVQPGAQDLHRPRLVLELRAFVLHRDDHATRHMRDPHRRVGRVDALPPGPARPVHVDLEIPIVDPHIDLVGLRQHGHRRRRRVDPALALGDGHSLHTVGTTLVLHVPPYRVAAQLEGDVVEPAHVARRRAQRLELPSISCGVGLVHFEQVASEQVGLLAALGAADLDDHVLAVVGVGRQHHLPQLDLEVGESGGEAVDLGDEHLALGGRSVNHHLARRDHVVGPRVVLPIGGDDGAEIVVALGEHAQLGRIGENLGVGELVFEDLVLLVDLAEALDHGGGG